MEAGDDLLCTGDAEQPAAQSRSLAAGGHASWAITGALLAAGVTLIALDGREARVAVFPTLLPGADGLASAGSPYGPRGSDSGPRGLLPGGAGLVIHVAL